MHKLILFFKLEMKPINYHAIILLETYLPYGAFIKILLEYMALPYNLLCTYIPKYAD